MSEIDSKSKAKSAAVLIDELDIPLAIRQKLASLGSSIATINGEIADLEEVKKSQMAIVRALAAEYDIPNVKLEGVFNLTLCQGKTTLSVERLLEEGIPMALIESCKKQGDPYWEVKRAKAKKEEK